MPTEKADLKRLSDEIATSAAPLRNIQFAHRNAAAVIGLSAIRRSADVDTYRASKGMSVEESANLGCALLAEVS